MQIGNVIGVSPIIPMGNPRRHADFGDTSSRIRDVCLRESAHTADGSIGETRRLVRTDACFVRIRSQNEPRNSHNPAPGLHEGWLCEGSLTQPPPRRPESPDRIPETAGM